MRYLNQMCRGCRETKLLTNGVRQRPSRQDEHGSAANKATSSWPSPGLVAGHANEEGMQEASVVLTCHELMTCMPSQFCVAEDEIYISLATRDSVYVKSPSTVRGTDWCTVQLEK